LAVGDIAFEYAFFLLPVTKVSTAAITKGELVSLKDGRKAAAGDPGPFGIAVAAIASGEDMKGKVLIKGVAYVAASGVISQFAYAKPDANGKVAAAAKIAVAYDSGANTVGTNPVESGSIPPDGLAGMVLDATTSDGDLTRLVLP